MSIWPDLCPDGVHEARPDSKLPDTAGQTLGRVGFSLEDKFDDPKPNQGRDQLSEELSEDEDDADDSDESIVCHGTEARLLEQEWEDIL